MKRRNLGLLLPLMAMGALSSGCTKNVDRNEGNNAEAPEVFDEPVTNPPTDLVLGIAENGVRGNVREPRGDLAAQAKRVRYARAALNEVAAPDDQIRRGDALKSLDDKRLATTPFRDMGVGQQQDRETIQRARKSREGNFGVRDFQPVRFDE